MMHVMAVDDERPVLSTLEKAIRLAVPECSLAAFTTVVDALAHARETPPDIAFLDVEMPGMDGLALAQALKEIHAGTNIVFVTGYAEYAVDAFAVPASGYLLKPVRAGDITQVLSQLRHPIRQRENGPRVRIACFGSFRVFVDGKPLLISQAKAKELLAYLVHKNGASATSAELASILWEDRTNNRSLQSQTRTVIAQLRKILRSVGAEDIITKEWNTMAIDVSKMDCDYHAFLRGDAAALNTYAGEYMNEYSWAEYTAGRLDRKVGLW